ncbi:MAG TPA: acyl carrier protein [Pyrinomonadaceae bacterium]
MRNQGRRAPRLPLAIIFRAFGARSSVSIARLTLSQAFRYRAFDALTGFQMSRVWRSHWLSYFAPLALSLKEIKQMELNGNQQAARQILVNLCTKNLNSQEITGDMSINNDLGIDSLQFIRLILEVEVNAGANIFNVQNIPEIKTVNDLYEVLSN